MYQASQYQQGQQPQQYGQQSQYQIQQQYGQQPQYQNQQYDQSQYQNQQQYGQQQQYQPQYQEQVIEHKSTREHLLIRPDMYIGNPSPWERLVHMITKEGLVEYTITTPAAMERVFLEIVTNFLDNVIESRKIGLDPRVGEITVTNTTVTVTNYGRPIPIKKNADGMYFPYMAFGKFRSGSNYGESRSGAGTNGEGAKCTVAVSGRFDLDAVDGGRMLRYQQRWRENMSIVEEPIITQCNEESRTTVTYELDFPFFKTTCYSDEDLQLFDTLAIFASLCGRIPVYFNSKLYNNPDMESFGNLILPKGTKRIIIEQEDIQILIADTPNQGTIQSFVNGMITRDGGCHVKFCLETIFDDILTKINGKFIDNVSKKTGKKMAGAELRKYKVYVTDILPHITVILVANVLNPEFNNQSKTKLIAPKVTLNVDLEVLKPICKWKLVHAIKETLNLKSRARLKASDGKFVKDVFSVKSLKANWAGDKRKDYLETRLFVSEGDSAGARMLKEISLIPGGNDLYGILYLRGVPINSLGSILKIEGNAEIVEIKKVLGLREEVDYSIPANFATLRYGGIVIAADADVDGKHIAALILLFFHTFYKSLLDMGYVTLYRTPIIRIIRGGQSIKFYTNSQYDAWLKEGNDPAGWKHKYYKGLGSSTKEEVKSDRRDNNNIRFLPDHNTDEMMNIAFNKKMSDTRKEYIRGFTGEFIPIINGDCSITDFLLQELGEFWKESVTRAIPNMSGNKNVHGKILYTALKRFPKLKKKENKYPPKVVVFAGLVTSDTCYDHGDSSMNSSIVKLAQNHVGGNNLPLLSPQGEYGSRHGGGADNASPRYLHVGETPLTRVIYNIRDDPILQLKVEEGSTIEPNFLLPVLPVLVFNGVKGIGTGSSSTMLPYHPLDVANWYKARLCGQQPLSMIPWYRGFNGNIMINRTEKCDIVTIEGRWDYNDEELIIHELPIGNVPKKLELLLQELQIKGQITKYTTHLDFERDNTSFRIYGWNHAHDPVKILKFRHSLSLSNMVVLDERGEPIHYKYIEDYMENFFIFRHKRYVVRKSYELGQLTKKIDHLSEKLKILLAVYEKRLLINNRSHKSIVVDIHKLELCLPIYMTLKLRNMCKEDIDKCRMKIDVLNGQVANLQAITIEQMWFDDISDFEREYKKIYPNDY